MKEKKDLRVVKTQKNIYNALTSLLKRKPFENIKVSDICTEALINRSTFYDHYNDKYELLIDYINNEKQMLEKALDTNKSINNTKEYYLELIKILINHIDNLKDVYHDIIVNNQNSIVINILVDVITKDVEKRIKTDSENNIPKRIITKFYVGAVANVCLEWFMNSTLYTKDEIINYLSNLLPDNNELY